MNDIILYIQYPGLGDHLQFSTLPELFSKKGHDVYIHTKSQFRNKEIYDLVWEKNPYIKGKKNGTPNAGQHKWHPGGQHIPQNIDSFIGCMERRNGLKKENDFPKIYYKSKNIETLNASTIIDINAISRKNDVPNKKQKLIKTIENLIEINNYKNIKVLNYTKFNHENNCKEFSKYEKININTIFDLCDVINSCNVFLCSHSGNSLLASAIKQNKSTPKIHCIPNWWPFEPWHIFGFPNIEYCKLQE